MFCSLHRKLTVRISQCLPVYLHHSSMAHADSKLMVIGALAGVAGVSLAAVWYHSLRSRRRDSWPATCLDSPGGSQAGGGLTVVDGGAGGGPALAGQAEVLDRLEALIRCVSELKDEMRALKSALPLLPDQVREEMKNGRSGGGGGGAGSRRTTPTRRKRAAAAAGLATRSGGQSSEEAESEGGYMTALTDSDEEEPSPGSPRQEEEEEEEGEEEPVDQLVALLGRVDALHRGDSCGKRQSLDALLEKKEEYGNSASLLWRLARAYCDAHDLADGLEEKKALALSGKEAGAEAVRLNPSCADSHQWYAIMCGLMAEYDTVQNKIKNGFIFKDHLDKAIELKPEDPMSYYLLGRWCYAVAQLSWIERKVATTLFGEPPSATVQDALKNFLKVEDISPGYSKQNYVFLAKCFKDLGQKSQARRMCEAACSMDTVSKEDEDAAKELTVLCPMLGV
ncbi:regulator of microtubule dynamics protein 2 [Gadus morhua]|uniref:Regulator of microtubule dynamics protein 2 n=2 Tax=Gadus morhua TaxID=8049 RepID=A0A8C4Z5K4_GADMO|nr:regulator of microtubule dynamics protein 2-like [Gadus morhua]